MRILWVGIRENDLPKLSLEQMEKLNALVREPRQRRVKIRGEKHHRITIKLLHLKPVDEPLPVRPFKAFGVQLAEVPLGIRQAPDFFKTLEAGREEIYRRCSEVALTELSEVFGPDAPNRANIKIAETVP